MQRQQFHRAAAKAAGHRALTMVGCFGLLVAGCAVGPNYHRPAVEVPGQFRNASEGAATNSLAELRWWELYKDETLSALIRVALTNNYDLRIAVSRVDQARAIAAQARSQFLPGIGYEGDISRGRNEFLGSPNPAGPGGPKTGNAVFAGLNASWELDLWGRIRRLNESARASFLATQEAQMGVRISLIAEVAQAYFELLELDRLLEIARHTTDSFKESARIFNQRFEAGGASRLDTSRAEAALASTAANIPDIERQIALKENQINVLIGHNPGPIARNSSLGNQFLPLEINPLATSWKAFRAVCP